ncbi:PTS transporter subunit EIIC [Thomasclavelia sp.]|uniref:PTS sugar transporter subunit IIC n=1 Tax=Thomasclavelia sp. TaxID=3025757 RepID=UPI0025D51239|nr:PTS transporter subunit EIIC [Thomasclavelia sp.]
MGKLEKIMDKLNPYMTRLANNPTLKGISSGMMGSIVVTLVGSLCLLLAVFPIDAIKNGVASLGLTPVFFAINNVTIGCLALYIVVLVTNSLVKTYKPEEDGVSASVIGLVSFLIVTPLSATADEVTAIPTTWLGAAGVFSALIIAIVTAKVFVFVKEKGWTIKMPASVPPMISRTFEGLIPGLIIAAIFIVVKSLFNQTSYGCMHQFVYSILQTPLQGLGGNLWAMCIFTIVAQLLWFFGIHGTNVMSPIYTPIWLTLDLANQAAVAQNGMGAGENIIGLAFFNTFTWGGCVLGFVLLMAFASKSAQYKSLGRIALVPALFGITEPVIFGTPLVLNFVFFIPFVFGNVIAILVAYLAIASGLVPTLMGASTVFGLPIGFHAAIQGSWQIVVLQIVVMVIVGLVWYPFFKKADNDAYKLEKAEQ